VSLGTLSIAGPINSLLDGISHEFSANWPIIAAALGAVFGLGVLLLFVERYLRDEHGRSLWLDEAGLEDWRDDEALQEQLDLMDLRDEREVAELNEELVAAESVWHVGSWDQLDDDPGWEWLGDDGELANTAPGPEYWEDWDTSESVGPAVDDGRDPVFSLDGEEIGYDDGAGSDPMFYD
jgi:hypothetical protein